MRIDTTPVVPREHVWQKKYKNMGGKLLMVLITSGTRDLKQHKRPCDPELDVSASPMINDSKIFYDVNISWVTRRHWKENQKGQVYGTFSWSYIHFYSSCSRTPENFVCLLLFFCVCVVVFVFLFFVKSVFIYSNYKRKRKKLGVKLHIKTVFLKNKDLAKIKTIDRFACFSFTLHFKSTIWPSQYSDHVSLDP